MDSVLWWMNSGVPAASCSANDSANRRIFKFYSSTSTVQQPYSVIDGRTVVSSTTVFVFFNQETGLTYPANDELHMDIDTTGWYSSLPLCSKSNSCLPVDTNLYYSWAYRSIFVFWADVLMNAVLLSIEHQLYTTRRLHRKTHHLLPSMLLTTLALDSNCWLFSHLHWTHPKPLCCAILLLLMYYSLHSRGNRVKISVPLVWTARIRETWEIERCRMVGKKMWPGYTRWIFTPKPTSD